MGSNSGSSTPPPGNGSADSDNNGATGGYEALIQDNTGKKVALDLESVPVTVRDVKCEGLGRTKNDYIEKAVVGLFQSRSFGELLLRVAEAQAALRSLEAFAEIGALVDTSKAPNASLDEYEVTFLLKESGRIRGKVQTDVGANEASARAGICLPNLLGRGEKLGLNYTVSSLYEKQSELSFTKPFPFIQTRLIANSSISTYFTYGTDINSWSGFKKSSLANSVEYDIKLKNRDSLKLSLLSVWRHLTPKDLLTSSGVRVHCGHSFKSSLRINYTRDKRDDSVFPSTGGYITANAELAGLAGDAKFIKPEVHAQKNFSLFSGIVAQFCSRAGFVLPLSSSRLSCNISDHFFLGGDQTFRGFQMRGVGPREGFNALGGRFYWSSAFHLYSPLPFKNKLTFSDKLRLHAFINVGNLASTIRDEDAIFPPRVSCGSGIVLKLAGIGRAELNYNIPLKFKKEDVPRLGFAFAFGTEFL